MTRHQRFSLHSVVRRLRPSSESFADAAAVYDPELMIQLKAARRRRAVRPSTAAEQPAPQAGGR